MSVIVSDTGFAPDGWNGGFVAFEDYDAGQAAGVDLAPDTDPQLLEGVLEAPMIRIAFPSSADGRGFTLARRLRLLGYGGHLRACGHVLSDQYAMARRAGFDEVEISDELAERQPWEHWKSRANWQSNDYQARLRGTP